MLKLKTKPVGIDVPIQKMQTFIHNKLIALWNIDETNGPKYMAYGRCYRNRDQKYGYIAENYKGDSITGGVDYEETYWDDNMTVVSFFGVANSIRHEGTKELASVHLVYFLDLAKVKPTIAHRADEEVHKDLLSLVGNVLHGFTYTGLDTGVDNVLREYPGSRRENRMVAVDMHPRHCFRLNFDLMYHKNIC
ncbi:hypothetical protein [Paraflavitalea sp. CAU 1676]|uniref:hypothetical protein n=1 Tax=Paraflavitalea sp. CAU 1676 TaxID=3032598 RepID=UPI0023DCA417|nr:hypothetical protein [Paraflavitalea sp. CAU 1676]MDF2189287.1 hypothetical protein [Paraflavitalea sp. CAU 1676]